MNDYDKQRKAMLEKEVAGKKQKIKDSQKTLASLDTLPQNNYGSQYDWKTIIEFRRSVITKLIPTFEQELAKIEAELSVYNTKN